MKAMRDISSGFGMEAMYHLFRKKSSENRILVSSSYRGRGIIALNKIPENLREFLIFRPGVGRINGMNLIELEDAQLKFDVKSYEVDHSIYGAYAYKIIGDSVIAYTGDIRFHGKNGEKTEKFAKSSRDASVLIIEGTRVGRKEGTISEKEVEENARGVIEDSKSLVVADFSARNFERMEIFRKIAEKASREIVITAKDAYMLHSLNSVDSIDRMKDMRIYGELRAKRDRWEKDVVMEKWGDKYIDPKEIAKNPENYILCFSFYDIKNLLDIGIQGGSYIYSSSEAFSEEGIFDFIRLKNWLQFLKFRTFGFDVEYSSGRAVPVFTRKFHSSGHLSEEEIRKVVDIIDPDYIIPVHTEHPEWFRENFENVIALNDGGSFEVP